MEKTKRRDFDMCSPSPCVGNALGLPPSLRRTPVTGYGVAKRKPDDGSWIREPDFFALRV
jgi:hypothetical protein